MMARLAACDAVGPCAGLGTRAATALWGRKMHVLGRIGAEHDVFHRFWGAFASQGLGTSPTAAGSGVYMHRHAWRSVLGPLWTGARAEAKTCRSRVVAFLRRFFVLRRLDTSVKVGEDVLGCPKGALWCRSARTYGRPRPRRSGEESARESKNRRLRAQNLSENITISSYLRRLMSPRRTCSACTREAAVCAVRRRRANTPIPSLSARPPAPASHKHLQPTPHGTCERPPLACAARGASLRIRSGRYAQAERACAREMGLCGADSAAASRSGRHRSCSRSLVVGVAGPDVRAGRAREVSRGVCGHV